MDGVYARSRPAPQQRKPLGALVCDEHGEEPQQCLAAFDPDFLRKALLVLVRQDFHLAERTTSLRGESEDMRAPIALRSAALHEPARLEAVEQANQARALDPQRLSEGRLAQSGIRF